MTDTGRHQALPVGYELHRYGIRSVLGPGGIGNTCLATDTDLDTEAAIKESPPGDVAVRARPVEEFESAGERARDLLPEVGATHPRLVQARRPPGS